MKFAKIYNLHNGFLQLLPEILSPLAQKDLKKQHLLKQLPIGFRFIAGEAAEKTCGIFKRRLRKNISLKKQIIPVL